MDRVFSAALIAVFAAGVFFYFWWGRFQYYDGIALTATYLGCLAVVAASHLRFGFSVRQAGLRLDNLPAALKTLLLPTALLATLIVALGLWNRDADTRNVPMSVPYLLWAFLQQYVLQVFLLRRFQTLIGLGLGAVAAAASLFALFHLPNLNLVAASLAGALIWCRAFARTPNLLAVTLSHAMLGLLLAVFLKVDLGQFRVGPGGYPYDAWGDGVQVAAGLNAEAQPVIATLPGHDRTNPSLVRIFRPDGRLIRAWEAFPEYGYSGFVAVGDLGFDDGDEVAVAPGPGPGNPSEVRVFSLDGREISRFRLPEPSGYGASISIAPGGVLATPGPAPGRSTLVYFFDPEGRLIEHWRLDDTGFHNSARALLLTEPESDRRLAVWGNPLSVNQDRLLIYDWNGRRISDWRVFGTAFGLNLTRIRLAAQGPLALLAGPGAAPGHQPHIRIFDREGIRLYDEFPYTSEEPCGATVAALDVDADGRDEMVLGTGNCPNQPPQVRVYTLEGRLLHQFAAR